VIVRSAEQTLALMVDDLIGREIIVIKPLGDYLKKVNLFSGATISGEGKVRLILDIPTIIEQELVSEIPGGRTSTRVQLGTEEYEEFEQPTSEKPKVPELLLVDDSISIRKVVGMFLINAGYKVDAATDGVDAMEKISKLPYDLIITDLEMPRMHGYELIAEIRSNETLNDVPIIVLTSRAGDKHHKKAVELGANDYIVKPVDEDTLLQSVKTLLMR
jgi:chemosensory pili system protein ChpA (sensor histidine kinase/response regulator)